MKGVRATMTNEWNSAEMGNGIERNLDARLAEYYGSALLEQPLEASSWQALRSQLGSRRPPRSRMARYLSMRRPVYALPRLLLFTVVPLAGIALALLRLIGIPLAPLLIATGLSIVLSMVVFWLLDRQRRQMAVSADSLMVQWLGRGRACQGLRALADRSRAPHRRRWGELSLTERIARICGTQVQFVHESLTLVR